VPTQQRPPTAPHSARPRDAASLVITRGRGRNSRVLLGRREPRDRFLPDLYVFPGGRVDPGDATRPVASELRGEVAQQMCRHGSAKHARALAFASIRETHEETGLVLGEIVDGRLCPTLHPLDYVARAITPAGNPIRYHARFFTANAEFMSGELVSNGELLDLEWRSFDASLELPMLDVTKFVLQTVARRLGHPAGAELPARAEGETPLIHYRSTALHIRYE
jgi:8-oxo-dGTP pyrophosphatase MutT (NUDIX family)